MTCKFGPGKERAGQDFLDFLGESKTGRSQPQNVGSGKRCQRLCLPAMARSSRYTEVHTITIKARVVHTTQGVGGWFCFLGAQLGQGSRTQLVFLLGRMDCMLATVLLALTSLADLSALELLLHLLMPATPRDCLPVTLSNPWKNEQNS